MPDTPLSEMGPIRANESYDLTDLVRQVQLRHGLSQRETAHLMGAMQSSLSNWHLGKGKPSLQMVEKLAQELGYTMRLELRPTPHREIRGTFAVHTANDGWLQHPDTFAHIAHALNVQVLIQSDLALHDHEYRVYADTVPITKTIHIGEDCGKRIRHAIERHLAHAPHEEPAQVDKPAPEEMPVAPAPAPAPAQLMQAKLF